MSGLNKVQIIGNLGRDPELRSTAGGQSVASFSVAVGRSWKDAMGAWQEETEWFRVVAWGDLANRSVDRLRKGSKVYVEGRLATREWEKDGVKRTSAELVASTVMPLDPRPRDGETPDLVADAQRIFGTPDDISDLPF